MKRGTLYIALGAVAIAAVVGVIAWRVWIARQPAEEARSAVVERGTVLVIVSASGMIEPQAHVDLAFESPGRVAEVPVKVGDRVEAGDLLARLNTEQLALQVQQSEARLVSARAQLAQLQVGPQAEEVAASEANLRATEAQVSAAAANRDLLAAGADEGQIAAAEAQVASATAEQKQTFDWHEQTMECFTFKLEAGTRIRGFVVPEDIKKTVCPLLGAPEEQARYALAVADASLAAAQAQLDELLAGADADEVRAAQANVWSTAAQRDATQAELDKLLAGATDEQIAAAEVQVEQARIALEEAELAVEKASLYAPFDGVVAAVNVEASETAPTGQPAITLVDTSRFHAIVSVDEIDVGKLVEGQTAEVTVDALPDIVLTGTVERTAPAATIEGGVVYYEVIIELVPTDAPIRSDMTASATIVVQELADVLTIPTWVVRVDHTTGQTYVYWQVGSDVERVDVELGKRYEGVAQVLGGLSEGDVVILVDDHPSFGPPD
jgi:HlyD family secretion protein